MVNIDIAKSKIKSKPVSLELCNSGNYFFQSSKNGCRSNQVFAKWIIISSGNKKSTWCSNWRIGIPLRQITVSYYFGSGVCSQFLPFHPNRTTNFRWVNDKQKNTSKYHRIEHIVCFFLLHLISYRFVKTCFAFMKCAMLSIFSSLHQLNIFFMNSGNNAHTQSMYVYIQYAETKANLTRNRYTRSFYIYFIIYEIAASAAYWR